MQMSSDYLELFWSLLDLSKHDELRSTIPRNFSWNILHPVDQTAVLVAACKLPVVAQEEERILDLIEWFVKSGASISQKSGNTNRCYQVWKTNDKDNTTIKVEFTGHSVMSYINAWRQALQVETAIRFPRQSRRKNCKSLKTVTYPA